MSAVGGVTGIGRMWWEGGGRVFWAQREPAQAFWCLCPLPFLLKPPTLVSQVSLLFCTLVLLFLSPGLSTFCSLVCSALSPILSGPACIGLWAQLRCPSPLLPHHRTPNISELLCGSTPCPCLCSSLVPVDRSKRGWDLEQSRRGYC